MFSSFDDISSLKTSDRPSHRKYSVTQAQKSNQCTTYLIWIIVLLIFCLLTALGISIVVWNELKMFRAEMVASSLTLHNAMNLTSENFEPTVTESQNIPDLYELEVEMQKLKDLFKELKGKYAQEHEHRTCSDGMKGDAGMPGPPGLPGITGTPGFPGSKGDSGQPGIPGQTGRPGFGMVGAPEPKGEEGPVGPPGLPGITGAPGVSGIPGMKGERGDEGLPGLHGLPGLPGMKGEPGEANQPIVPVRKGWRQILNG